LRKKQLTQSGPLSSPAFVPIALNHSRVPTQAITGAALVVHHRTSALYFDVAPHPDWLAQLLRALA